MRLKRQQTYVDSSVQGSLLRRIFFHWVVFFFVTSLSLVTLQTLLGDPSKTIGQRVSTQMGEFIFIGLVLLALLPAFMLDTIRFSNRFVGPILRLRRHLRELGNDLNTEPCAFRDNDFWAELANEYNVVANLIKNQQEEIAELKTQLGKQNKVDA